MESSRREGRPAADGRDDVLELERVLEANRSLVFEMWAKGRNLPGWLTAAGPDEAPGRDQAALGRSREVVMRSADGRDVAQSLTYREISAPDRLVFAQRPAEGVETLVSVGLEALPGDRTKLVLRHSGLEGAEARRAQQRIWTRSLDGLERHLERYLEADRKLAPAGDPDPLVLTIERVFDAPRALLFRLWSAPEHVARWWGPHGYQLSHCEMDFREGGRWRFCMMPPDGQGHWIHGEYREIRPPERLSFTYVNDADGQQMLVELDFIEEGQKTRLKFRQAEFMSVLERNAHRGGWTATFDILDRYVDLYGRGALPPSRLGWRQGEVPGIQADLPPPADR